MRQLKKLLAIFISAVIITSGSLNTYAAFKPLYAWLQSIVHVSHEEYETVTISFNAHRDINYFTLKSPDRIVIDVKYSLINGKPQTISGGKLIESIRYAQFEKNVVRVVLDTKGAQNYKIKQEDNIIKLYVGDLNHADKEQNESNQGNSDQQSGREQGREQEQSSRSGTAERGDSDRIIENPISKNLIYNNLGDRVCLSIQGTCLTEGGENYKKLFSEKYSDDGLTYTLTFDSILAKLDKGTIEINDRYLETITVNKNLLSLKTSIILKAKDKFVYHVMARSQLGDTAITILKPASDNEKLVVIDAGHGGSEPGTIYKGLIEKNVNLDIALKLNDLLKKNNIKTYMIREDDSYVSLYERAYIANKLNASLFLSIHNNALENNPSFDGTMTLYSIN
ncbi:MAG: N-acetylmuramoyl-L-alanine amidase, partial [Clostridiaceae bacterium]|nr:N-acetylmuramoyl-L-alanine amidase [Clostridiaceae bacterium]